MKDMLPCEVQGIQPRQPKGGNSNRCSDKVSRNHIAGSWDPAGWVFVSTRMFLSPSSAGGPVTGLRQGRLLVDGQERVRLVCSGLLKKRGPIQKAVRQTWPAHRLANNACREGPTSSWPLPALQRPGQQPTWL